MNVANHTARGFMQVLALSAALVIPCATAQDEPAAQGDVKLPSGKSQREEILKDDHAKSLRDVARVIKLAEELKAELEKNDYRVLSVSSLKKTEDIEKLARQIRGRMRRF